MSLPVSQYEALLAEVRGLRRKAQRVQQLATPLISHCSSSEAPKVPPFTSQFQDDEVKSSSSYNKMEPLLMGRQQHNDSSNNCDGAASSSVDGDTTCSEDEYGGVRSTHLSVSSEPITHRDRGGGGGGISMLYHGTWPVEKTMWNSEPTPHRSSAATAAAAIHHHNSHMQEVTSVMSFASSSGGVPLDRVLGSPSLSRRSSQQQLEAKVDMVYSLLAMLSGQEHADMGETLLALSTNPESCLAMRQSGCIPLLVQILQSDREPEARKKASQALHNLVQSQPDEKMRKREVRVFKLLEHARAYTEALRNDKEFEPEAVTSSSSEDDDRHPVQTVAHLMKLSFDELHRQAICTLGGIHTIAGLVEAEHSNHGSTADEAHCILMRRYACMALTNLTFGDSGNKALLCSFREFMRALVVQLQSPSDELRQVTASVLRNLSWRADSSSKEILREVGSVTGLMKAAMLADNKENTLKSILSALWNLSAHCTENKSEICSVEGALGFLVDALRMRTPAIVENAGGILRNVSSQIAVRDDYREVLRQHDCLQVLLDQLKSPSLTVVSNACGTLWNLSAKCPTDQEALWRMGAPAMLRSLNHSKHKMIAMGSSAALKNLLGARPSQQLPPTLDSTAMAMDLPALPTLGARKQKALLQDLDQTLSETYENIEKESPIRSHKDDLAQKKRRNNSPPIYEPDFSSLNYSEPSTSGYESSSKFSSNYSLPHQEFGGSRMKCFLKSTSKAPNSAGTVDSGLQSLESPVEDLHLHHRQHQCNSSSNSIDNDKYKKLKEVSIYSDEKDHCSIEDVSDSDNQSSLGLEHKQQEESVGYLTVRREAAGGGSSSAVSTPSLPPPKYANLGTSNITMFDGDIDEIDMEDISIHFASDAERSKDLEENTEKQDVEKEKKSMNEEHFTDFIGIRTETWIHAEEKEEKPVKTPTRSFGSGIPLPRSSPRPIPSSTSNGTYCQDSVDIIGIVDTSMSLSSSMSSSTADVAMKNNSESSDRKTTATTTNTKSNRLLSNLPRRSLQTSTPIRIIAGPRSLPRPTEASKVDSIEGGGRSLTESTPSTIECSLPAVEPSTLNISEENNANEDKEDTSSKPEDLEMEDKPAEVSPMEDEGGCFGSCLNPTDEDERRDRLLERSCEESNPVDNRMLDPDAMIESLDRFTAELVSQASHLQQSKDEDKYKDNTWNEDTSPNEVTFPSLSSNAPNVITFDSNDSEAGVAVEEEVEEAVKEPPSNDFSSMNTATTMTESTLIAIEATKMASVFKNEAEMSHSMSSVASLELDKVQPPSLLDSLSNSDCGKSPPKTAASSTRRRSLPRGLMVRRALSNGPANNGSSLESLSNLDQMNPPSAMADVIDMEGSITSVASLPNETSGELVRADFVINGAVKNSSFLNNNNNNTSTKAGNMINLLVHNSHLNSISDLENINPPSLLNEITDLCNSLADVATEAIGSETEPFEDCCTHVEDDATEFSDANSATPIQSDLPSSSPEVSPRKKSKAKQRRNAARDRYKTYTVAPETLLVLKQEEEEDKQQSTSEDFRTVSAEDEYRSVIEDSTATAATYSVKRSTPKERRRNDRSRFETQVVEEAITDILQQPVIDDSPSRSRLSVRRNFMQKRLENKDRFKTQTLTEPTFSPEPVDIHVLVRKEADLVLKSLRETKTTGGSGGDELLDCETLSLVSNDDDSEQNNSGSPINYRTYHKSWGMKKNVPVIEPAVKVESANQDGQGEEEEEEAEEEEEEEQKQPVTKPKIVKPSEKAVVEATEEEAVEEEPPQGKAIRGRRKPLYSKTTPGNKVVPKTLRPIKSMTSNLVKNVASSIKSQVKQANGRNVAAVTKPPISRVIKSTTSPKTTSKSKASPTPTPPPPLERQGTFTKDEPATPKSRIPTTATSRASSKPPPPSSSSSKIPAKNNNKPPGIPRSINSASSDRANRNTTRTNYYGRSTSADSREPVFGNRKIQSSVSSQSLKNERPPTAKRSSIPHPTQRVGSNTSLNSTTTTTTTTTTTSSAKKQVTSKIASLWKKIEESKNKQPTKKDTRVWIEQGQGSETTGGNQLIRSNTFDNKNGVTLRNRTQEENPEKRVSRLGSFIVMDDTEDGARLQQIINAAATE